MSSDARVSLTLGPGQRIAGLREFKAPEPVGLLVLVDGFQVQAHSKPNWWQRWAMRLVFGWKWSDL
ncbi:hypothetical protein ABE488_09200 [Luteimonas sp. TWI662]|uniref:hypothetical protein n=1 Tax=Luteimonas sp. TWI662 TaxID=3136789 RepID=UPI00320803BB